MSNLEYQLSFDSLLSTRDFLTIREVGELREGARASRYPTRNDCIILMLFRHGLRESELIDLKLSDINLKGSKIWVNRLKNGISTEHPVQADTLDLLKKYLNERGNLSTPHLFVNERGQRFTRQQIHYIVKQAGIKSDLGVVNPTMLRHACGFYLANTGCDQGTLQAYLGHVDPKHTRRYFSASEITFTDLWKD